MIAVEVVPSTDRGLVHSPIMRHRSYTDPLLIPNLPLRPMVGDVMDLGDGWDNYVIAVHIDVRRGGVMAVVSPEKP